MYWARPKNKSIKDKVKNCPWWNSENSRGVVHKEEVKVEEHYKSMSTKF